jgi:hypothetical protein
MTLSVVSASVMASCEVRVQQIAETLRKQGYLFRHVPNNKDIRECLAEEMLDVILHVLNSDVYSRLRQLLKTAR